MAKRVIDDSTLKAVADKIREKAPDIIGNDTFTPTEIPEKVDDVYTEGYTEGESAGKQIAENKPYIDTSKITNFTHFCSFDRLNDAIQNIDTSKGTIFYNMFKNCSSLTTIPKLDTSKGTDFTNMFHTCTSLTTIPELDTSKGTSFTSMFHTCTSLTTIPELDTSKGTNFDSMFHACSSLTTIPKLDTSKGTDFTSMFHTCNSLTTIPELDTSNGTRFTYMFHACSSLTTIPKLDTSKGTNFTSMFHNCNSLTTISKLDGSESSSFNVTFYNCGALENIVFEGTIKANIDMHWSPLSKESITSVINALSGTATGKTLTLKKKAADTAFAWNFVKTIDNAEALAGGERVAEYINDVASYYDWGVGVEIGEYILLVFGDVPSGGYQYKAAMKKTGTNIDESTGIDHGLWELAAYGKGDSGYDEAYIGEYNDEWKSLVEAKSNWTISLV